MVPRRRRETRSSSTAQRRPHVADAYRRNRACSSLGPPPGSESTTAAERGGASLARTVMILSDAPALERASVARAGAGRDPDDAGIQGSPRAAGLADPGTGEKAGGG